MLNWHVVIAKPNHDHLVAKGLRELGCADVHLAKTFARGRPAGLLIPGCVLVLMDCANGEHGPVRNTRGVSDIIPKVGDPERMPAPLRGGAPFVAMLRQAEDEEFCGATAKSRLARDDLARGMLVRIDKPGIIAPGDDRSAAAPEGRIVRIRHRKVTVLIGVVDWTVDDVDVSIVE